MQLQPHPTAMLSILTVTALFANDLLQNQRKICKSRSPSWKRPRSAAGPDCVIWPLKTQIWNLRFYIWCVRFPLAVTASAWRRRCDSLPCLIFLSHFCGYACSVRWILSLPLSLGPRVPSYWRGNCISTDTEWNEFGGLWNAQAHKGGRKVQQEYRDNLSAMDLVRFCSSYYPVSWQSDSEDWEWFFSVLGVQNVSRLSEETRLCQL